MRRKSPSPRRRSPARAAPYVAAAKHAPGPKRPDTLRDVIFQLGFALIRDILLELALLVVTVPLLLSWRLPRTIRIYRTGQRKTALWAEFGELLRDLSVGVPALALVLCTLYRIRELRFNRLRASAAETAAKILTDIGGTLCWLSVVVLFPWRLPYARDHLKLAAGNPYGLPMDGWRLIGAFQAVHGICDLFVVPFIPVLLLGAWRLKDLYRQHFSMLPSTRLAQMPHPRPLRVLYAEYRKAVVDCTGEIMLDYFCFLIVLLIIVTVVRVPMLWRAIKNRKNDQESFRESFYRTVKEEFAFEKGAPTATASAAPSSPAPHAAASSDDVEDRIDAAKSALQGLTQAALKAMLRKNDQAFSNLSTRDMIARIADQQVRGRIPRCPRCYAGKLRFENGVYRCPGYVDDEAHFHACKFAGDDGTVTRSAWTD